MKVHRAEPISHQRFEAEQLGFLSRLLFRSERKDLGLNQRMLKEDFSRVFNHSNRNRDGLFCVITNDTVLLEKLLANVMTNFGPHSGDEIIRDWTEEIAQSLLWFGKAYYWLYQAKDGDQFHLKSFSTSGIVSAFGIYLQFVPKRIENHWNEPAKKLHAEVRVLNSQCVLQFILPINLERKISKQIKTLKTLDRYEYGVTAFFPQATHRNPNPTSNFDFAAWKANQDRAFFRSAINTGWNGRKYSTPSRSEFFDSYRLIRFRRNQLVLRDSILGQIGEQISKVGRAFNRSFTVKITCTDELPSIRGLNDLESRLEREEVGFTDVIEYCLKR